MINHNFNTATSLGELAFTPSNLFANIHTTISLRHLVLLTGVLGKKECDVQDTLNSPSIYINADNYISDATEYKASLLGFDGEDTIKKLNFLGASVSGVYLHFPGYKFKKHDLSKLYNWLNSGIKSYNSSQHCLKDVFKNPLRMA